MAGAPEDRHVEWSQGRNSKPHAAKAPNLSGFVGRFLFPLWLVTARARCPQFVAPSTAARQLRDVCEGSALDGAPPASRPSTVPTVESRGASSPTSAAYQHRNTTSGPPDSRASLRPPNPGCCCSVATR